MWKAYAENMGETTEASKVHAELRLSYIKLSRKYGYSASVIRMVAGAR